MKLYFLLFLVLFLSGCTSAPKKRTDKLSILQGITSVKEVEFSILAPVNKVLTFELRSAEGEVIEPDEVKTVTRPFSEWAIHKVVFVRDQLKEFKAAGKVQLRKFLDDINATDTKMNGRLNEETILLKVS